MPFAIDQDAINDTNLKTMDILKPPTKSIPFQEFPKMLYLHPKDKTREHLTKIVQNAIEEVAALKEGWRTQQHIQQPKEVDLTVDFEADIPEEQKRGPGRPRMSESN